MTAATHSAGKSKNGPAETVPAVQKASSGAAAPKGTGGAAPAPAPTARRGMAAKEVIPFEWKLVGYSCGTAVTLFKAVEREDVEVQLLRVQRDGYYKDLKVLDVKTKVVQPPTAPVVRVKKAPVKKTAKPAAKKTVAKQSSGKTVSMSTAKAAKKTSGKKPTTRKKTTKTAAKAAKKKKHAAKNAPKRKAKAS